MLSDQDRNELTGAIIDWYARAGVSESSLLRLIRNIQQVSNIEISSAFGEIEIEVARRLNPEVG